MVEFKIKFRDAWDATKSVSGTGRPMDGLLVPAAPSLSIPHDFGIWWGYTSLFNLLDHPSTILPIKDFKVDAVKDARNADYKPLENRGGFDRANWDMCKLYSRGSNEVADLCLW